MNVLSANITGDYLYCRSAEKQDDDSSLSASNLGEDEDVLAAFLPLLAGSSNASCSDNSSLNTANGSIAAGWIIAQRFRQLEEQNKLIGRSTEMDAIFKAYTGTRGASAPSKVIRIEGRSGSGKTTLVRRSLRGQICLGSENGGWFVEGKWDVLQTKYAPLSGIVAALSDLFDLLETQCDRASQERIRGELNNALSNNEKAVLFSHFGYGRAISSLLPGVPDEASFSNPSACSENEVENAFRILMRILSSPETPLMVFLDDLQWIDPGSLGILRSLITDKHSENILYILSHRTNDGSRRNDNNDDSKVGGKKLVDLSDLFENDTFLHLNIGKLNVEDINQMIQFCLETYSSPTTSNLAQIIAEKTLSTPFEVQEFLLGLATQNLVVYKNSDGGGFADMDLIAIRNETDIMPSVAIQVRDRLDRLDPRLKAVLIIGAFLGHKFDSSVLKAVAASMSKTGRTSDESIGNRLEEACQERLIEPICGKVGWYKFSHDSIQSCIYNMSPAKSRMHIMVGKYYASLLLREEDARNLVFEVADHMNRGSDILADHNVELIGVAEDNLVAAQEAFVLFDHFAASHYATTGLACLRDITNDCWTGTVEAGGEWRDLYHLIHKLSDIAVQTSHLLGDYERCMSLASAIILHARSKKDKINANLAMLKAIRIHKGDYAEAMQFGVKLLREYAGHISIPETPTMKGIKKKLGPVRKLIKKLKDDEILAKVKSTNTNSISLATFSTKVLTECAFFAQLANKKIVATNLYLCLIEETMGRGIFLAESTPQALASYGVCERIVGGKKEVVSRVGMLVTKLLDHPAVARTTGLAMPMLMAFSFLNHRTVPLYSTVPKLLRVFQDGIADGELHTAFFGLTTMSLYEVNSNVRLEDFEAGLKRQCSELTHEMKQDKLVNFVLIYLQMAQCLIGMADDPCELSGDALQEDTFLLYVESSENYMILTVYYQVKLALLVTFGMTQRFQATLSAYNKLKQKNVSNVGFRWKYGSFFSALAHFDLWKLTKNRSDLTSAKKILKDLRQMKKDGYVNETPLCLLLEAEEMAAHYHGSLSLRSLNKSSNCTPVAQVIAAYNRASAAAKEIQMIHIEAIATERLGRYLLQQGSCEGDVVLDKAKQLYFEWGAQAKVENMI